MTNRQMKIIIGIMFFFLISLVFICDKSHGEMWTRNEPKIKAYQKFYAMGQRAADYDAKHKQLWKQYKHFPHENKKHDAFLDGYLDTAAYYAMPGLKRLQWDLENPDWRN